eukprot:scaffold22577_cov122-Cylindrotheca_fusiformis.AAC.37
MHPSRLFLAAEIGTGYNRLVQILRTSDCLVADFNAVCKWKMIAFEMLVDFTAANRAIHMEEASSRCRRRYFRDGFGEVYQLKTFSNQHICQDSKGNQGGMEKLFSANDNVRARLPIGSDHHVYQNITLVRGDAEVYQRR